MIAIFARWLMLTQAMSSGRICASTNRLSSLGTISTSGAPGRDRAADGGDEHAVDPAGERRADDGALDPVGQRRAGARRSATISRLGGGQLVRPRWARQSWRCWASVELRLGDRRLGAGDRRSGGCGLAGRDGGGVFGLDQGSRGSMPRSTSGRIRIRASALRGAAARD